MQIHATNIHGLGASQVVKSFLDASSNLGFLDTTTIYLPSTGLLSNYIPNKGQVKRYKRILPNNISRLFECLFSRFLFSNEKTIILGDIPLRGIKNQVVLVHQPNLVYPRINSNSSSSLGFRFNRFLFSVNNKFASTIIVQTGAMADDLIKSYPGIKERVVISPQPVPSWLKKEVFIKNKKSNGSKLILFYPAAFYPHKKHQFLISLNNYIINNSMDLSNFEIWVTLDEEDFSVFKSIPFLKNMGRLSTSEMNLFYKKVDALLFLSSMESYGLPLIESVTLNLPIVTVGFNYSRWICENEAYYFEPYNVDSFIKAIESFRIDYEMDVVSNYDKILKKFPESWDVIATTFFKS